MGSQSSRAADLWAHRALELWLAGLELQEDVERWASRVKVCNTVRVHSMGCFCPFVSCAVHEQTSTGVDLHAPKYQ